MLRFPNGAGIGQLLTAEQQRIRQLEAEVSQLKSDNALLKKSIGLLCPRTKMTYALVDQWQQKASIMQACRLLGVSRSGYFASKQRAKTASMCKVDVHLKAAYPLLMEPKEEPRVRVLLIILTFFSVSVSAKDLFFMWQELPPITWEENNVVRGGMYDIMVAACQKQNIKCRFNMAPVVRGMRELELGHIDGFLALAPNKDREAFSVLSPALITVQFGYLRLKGATKMTNLSNLSGYEIGVVRGSTSLKMVQNHTSAIEKLTIDEETDIVTTLKKLAAGRYGEKGAIFGVISTLEFEAKKLGIEVEPILTTDVLQLSNLFSKKSVDSETLTRFFKTLEEMKQSGEVANILKPYALTASP
ncbi:transporter substrate-binding domain-containing protein [Chitinimonas sp. PSY-7]|uniref:transporter substrate-binding domain-containing protein n=1 Tax=Chitinimonas sp. PSY-7 TaxID=3459088 RepID=UPI0040400789